MKADAKKTGILLINLGTPDSASIDSVKKYLAQFLSDPRVVELPAWIWRPILHALILRTRPKKTAHAYQKIWTESGSPLLNIAKQQTAALAKLLPNTQIKLAMRYGNPSIANGLKELQQQKIEKLIIFPLYPQYSSAATGTAIAEVMRIIQHWRVTPELHCINQYAENSVYIKTVAQSINEFWQKNPRGEKLLFSFHGLPENSIKKGDPYFSQCHRTAKLIAEQLQLSNQQWQVVFQSRFGLQRWLQPYCDKTLKIFPKQGITSVDIVCPGFSADCLETLEEIALRNQEIFMKAGGVRYQYIPALNDSAEHIQVLNNIIQNYLA